MTDADQTPQSGARPRDQTRALSCPNCGGSVTIAASGISISVVCRSCGSVLDVAGPEVRKIADAVQRTVHPSIEIGTRGDLAGATWEVIGFQIRLDTESEWEWNEYLLFNPYLGFRFLTHDEEGWNFFCMLREDVADPRNGVAGHRYDVTSSGTARTTYIMGEFYWRARAGDEAIFTEYTSGQHLLSREQNKDEIVWSHGVRMAPDQITKAFAIKQTPTAAGGADATSSAAERRKGVLVVGASAIAFLFLLHIVGFGTSRSTVVYSQTFHTTDSDKGRTLTSEPFVIPESGGNVRLAATAPVRNSWVELDVTLAGPNGVTFHATPSIEYYFGSDDDGDWSEGSQTTTTRFSSVPGGTYRLMFEPYAGAYGRPSFKNNLAAPPSNVDFTISVTRHVPDGWAFAAALCLLVPYPAYKYLFGRPSRAGTPLKSPGRT